MDSKKLYESKVFVQIVQVISLFLIAFSNYEIVFKLMLASGYIMLFIQKRWHKHLLIMLVMISIVFITSHIYMV